MPRLHALQRRCQPSNGTILVRIKPEDHLERPVEVGREPQGELDGRYIATDFQRQDRVAGDLQVGCELFLCQPVLLTELAEPVDDGLLHELRTFFALHRRRERAQRLLDARIALRRLNVKHA